MFKATMFKGRGWYPLPFNRGRHGYSSGGVHRADALFVGVTENYGGAAKVNFAGSRNFMRSHKFCGHAEGHSLGSKESALRG